MIKWLEENHVLVAVVAALIAALAIIVIALAVAVYDYKNSTKLWRNASDQCR